MPPHVFAVDGARLRYGRFVEGEHQPDLRPYTTQDVEDSPQWSDDILDDPDRIAEFAAAVARRSMVPGPPVAQITICRPIDLTQTG